MAGARFDKLCRYLVSLDRMAETTTMSTTTLHISLPEALKEFALKRVEDGAYSNPSDYVRTLIRADREGLQELRRFAATSSRASTNSTVAKASRATWCLTGCGRGTPRALRELWPARYSLPRRKPTSPRSTTSLPQQPRGRRSTDRAVRAPRPSARQQSWHRPRPPGASARPAILSRRKVRAPVPADRGGIEVVRVLHGMRDLDRIFGEGEKG